MSLLINRLLVNLHAKYLSYLQDHSKLVKCGYLSGFIITEKSAEEHVDLQDFTCGDLLKVLIILGQLKVCGQIWQEPHNYIIHAGHLTPTWVPVINLFLKDWAAIVHLCVKLGFIFVLTIIGFALRGYFEALPALLDNALLLLLAKTDSELFSLAHRVLHLCYKPKRT